MIIRDNPEFDLDLNVVFLIISGNSRGVGNAHPELQKVLPELPAGKHGNGAGLARRRNDQKGAAQALVGQS